MGLTSSSAIIKAYRAALELHVFAPHSTVMIDNEPSSARDLAKANWLAAGLMDTEIGCFHLSEAHDVKKDVQPRVQAWGGEDVRERRVTIA